MAMVAAPALCLATPPTVRGAVCTEAVAVLDVARGLRFRPCIEIHKRFSLREMNHFGGYFPAPKRRFCGCNPVPSGVLRQVSSRANLGDASPERGDTLQDGLWVEKLPYGDIHNKGDIVAGKYTIKGVLGQGAVGVTYEAEREDGEVVALKAMSLRNMKGWKDLDLFEREARVLKSLNHPGIPAYIDHFQVDTDFDLVFYIAQRSAKGKSIADLIRNGWRVTEEEVKSVALEVLAVLQYLGDLRPPVIHRDIKPENIILDKETGSVKVVDFGAVQDLASSMVIGSTVVGTYGYMAPEQFQNRAALQTDLYGLGGTMLYMLSGHPPSYFPQKRLKVEFRNLVTMSTELADTIDRLLEPAPEDRFQSPKQVVHALQEAPNGSPSVPSRLSEMAAQNARQTSVLRPAGTQVELSRDSNGLRIVFPASGFTQDTAESGAFTVIWNAFVAFWTRSAFAGGGPLFAAFSLPFWFVGLRLAKRTLLSTTVSTRLEFCGPHFTIEWSIGDMWRHRVIGEVSDIRSVELVAGDMEGAEQATSRRITGAVVLKEGRKKHVIGSSLEADELHWLVTEIKSQIEESTSTLLY